MTRLYTEDVNRDGIERVLAEFVDGYTLISAIGAWKGVKENTLIIEIENCNCAETIALRIAEVNNQEAVMVQEFTTANRFVSRAIAA